MDLSHLGAARPPLQPSFDNHPAPITTPETSPPAKRRRTSSAARSGCCRTCRLRKVKCSGNPGNGPCTNCARLELSCPFVAVNETTTSDKISRIRPSHSHTEAGTLRKRAQRACGQCHSQKTKCSGDLPRCRRCESSDLKCEYTAPKRKFANVRFGPPSTAEEAPQMTATLTSTSTLFPPKSEKSTSVSPIVAPHSILGLNTSMSGSSNATNRNFPLAIDFSTLKAEELLLRKNFLLRHMDAYFDNLYWLPCMGFFHPQTAYRQVYEGNFDPPTAAALCAVTSFWVSPGQGATDFSMKCLDEVEFFIFRNLHKFTDRVLVPYALILFFSYLNGLFAKVWQCFGFFTRVMTGMQLNWENSSGHKSFHDQEHFRRLAWHAFVMDRMLAGGYEEYISNRAENIKIRLPCSEDAFWENKPVVAERLYEKDAKGKGIGLHGLNIRIVDISHRIQGWTRKLAQRAPLEPSIIMEDINNLQNELSRFHSSIPDDLRLSDQSISKYMALPERVGYVYLHIHLAVAHIDLYRFALPGILDSTNSELLRRLPQDFVERCRKQAIAHALLIGRFCVASQDEIERLPDMGRVILAGDCTIPHMVTQALRVFLIAMQHNIYYDITTDTTAPLWRFEQPNEDHIRGLIMNGLFRITEPWCSILLPSQKAHASNKAMFAEFEKTRKFADQKGTVGFSGPRGRGGANRLPGPHYILENANSRVVEEEKRTKASNAAAADRWFSQPKHTDFDQTASYPLPDNTCTDFMEYGPPGVPTLLAVARNTGSEPGQDMQNMYETERDAAVLVQEKMWLSGGMMAPEDDMMVAAAAGMGPVMQMGPGTDPSMMFQPPHPPPGPQGAPQFMTTQPGMSQPEMFITGYAPQYNGDSTGYMQQGNFN